MFQQCLELGQVTHQLLLFRFILFRDLLARLLGAIVFKGRRITLLARWPILCPVPLIATSISAPPHRTSEIQLKWAHFLVLGIGDRPY